MEDCFIVATQRVWSTGILNLGCSKPSSVITFPALLTGHRARYHSQSLFRARSILLLASTVTPKTVPG